jgi:cell division protein FtsZ
VITDYIQDKAGLSADLIWGNCIDENLQDNLSVTIIATGFQTTEQRAKDKDNVKKISLLTPEEAPLVRPVEPVNSFIEAKVEPVNIEPVLKVQEEQKQSDLFGDLFNLDRTSTKADTAIHYLIEDEKTVSETQEANFEFEVKLAETEFVFETPVAELEIEQEEDITPEPIVAVQEEVIGLDDHKNDESIEDQLRKSKERILKLKDLSMKLRTSNGLQELENEPAYKRKQMQLQQVQHSSESQVSRFTLSNDEEGSTEIRPNNSFLHDNVD